jgi:type IV fimbrial biogenesis protein FimT
MSLVELLTAIAIVVIALTLGIPSFNGVATSLQRVQASAEIADSFTMARSEAARRGVTVRVCASADSINCSTDEEPSWAGGWIVFTDLDENSLVDAGTDEMIHGVRYGNPHFTLTANRDIAQGVVFRGSGFPDHTGRFDYCDERESRVLELTYVGRVEIVSTGEGCP